MTLMSQKRAERVARDNQQAETCGWSYKAVPSDPANPKSAWCVQVFNETGELEGVL